MCRQLSHRTDANHNEENWDRNLIQSRKQQEMKNLSVIFRDKATTSKASHGRGDGESVMLSIVWMVIVSIPVNEIATVPEAIYYDAEEIAAAQGLNQGPSSVHFTDLCSKNGENWVPFK